MNKFKDAIYGKRKEIRDCNPEHFLCSAHTKKNLVSAKFMNSKWHFCPMIVYGDK